MHRRGRRCYIGALGRNGAGAPLRPRLAADAADEVVHALGVALRSVTELV